jgi:hypothetical protein
MAKKKKNGIIGNAAGDTPFVLDPQRDGWDSFLSPGKTFESLANNGDLGPGFTPEDAPGKATMTPEQLAALEQYQGAIGDYVNGSPEQYGVAGNLSAENLGPSAMEGISTDPRYHENELAALRDLENQSRDGFTARDRANLAQAEQQANRANQGRIGAIKQQMAARGGAGTGMEMVAQMQSSQDSNELEAMRALEIAGMASDRRAQATRDMGNMSSQLQQRDFGQAAAKAQAKDQIAKFNNTNRMDANRFNLGNRQDVANKNTAGANTFRDSAMQAKLGGAQMGYNAATELANRDLLNQEEWRKREEAKRKGLMGTVGGVAGGVFGGMFGGAQGASAGVSGGSQLGGAYGSDKRLKKDVAPEHEGNIEAFLATIQPKSYSYKDEDKPRHGVLADDLEKSIIGSDMIRRDEAGMRHVDIPDAISALMQAVAHLNKKVGR